MRREKVVNDTELNDDGEVKKSRIVWANHPLDGRTLMLIAAIVGLGIFTFWNAADHQKQILSRASYYHKHDHEHGDVASRYHKHNYTVNIDCSGSSGYGDLAGGNVDYTYADEGTSHDHYVSGLIHLNLDINCDGYIR